MSDGLDLTEALAEGIAQIQQAGRSTPTTGRDPVNQPMINNWLEAIGDRNPIYVDDAAARAAGHRGIVAPPAMIQVWTMAGLGGGRPADDPLGRIIRLFDDAGYVGVVATNCEQTYHRYLLPGEQVHMSAELGEVVGPKQTALGEGWFINQHITWTAGGATGADAPGAAGEDAPGELVAEMHWRILKFRPTSGAVPAAGQVPDDLDPNALLRPAVSPDTQFFWDGVTAHELRIQRLADGTLQHPPVPAVWQDRDAPVHYLVASGRGTVFSFVVHHAPRVPGRTLPFVIALVELAEGVRLLGELRNVDPATVEIGMEVRATYLDFPASDSGPAWSLYAWEPAE